MLYTIIDGLLFQFNLDYKQKFEISLERGKA